MHHHPNIILALHHERQHRLEVEAARYAMVKNLIRRRLSWRRRSGEPQTNWKLRPLSP